MIPIDPPHIETKINDFLTKELGLERKNLCSNTPLFSSGELDSMDMLKMVTFIEECFDIPISPIEVSVEVFDTPALITDFIVEVQSHNS